MSRKIFPESGSTHSTESSVPFSLAVVSQICFSSSTGDDHARPWVGVFQRTFSVSDHFSGSNSDSTAPWPEGPRNSGQVEEKPVAQMKRAARAILGVKHVPVCMVGRFYKSSEKPQQLLPVLSIIDGAHLDTTTIMESRSTRTAVRK